MKPGDFVTLHEPQHDIHGSAKVMPDAQGVVDSEHTYHPGWFWVAFPGRDKCLLFDSDDLRVINAVDQLGDLAR